MKKKWFNSGFHFGSFENELKKMKLIIVFFFAGLLAVSANSYSQQIKFNLHLNDKSVKEVFNQIEENSEFILFYNEDYVDVNRKINLFAQESDIEYILDEIFKGTNNTYKIYDRQIVILAPGIAEPNLNFIGDKQQPGETIILGTVTDSKGTPIPGVSIIAKGTTIGIVTDLNGNYTLEVPAETETIIFSFIGMKTQEITIGDNTRINVTMVEEAVGVDEVVVVGYGTKSSRLVTGSVQQISTGELGDIPVAQLTQSLQGKFSGVQINQASGIPGEGMFVRIRGQVSITADNQPLYVVDGMPIIGDLSSINPNEIESISVLKDAAATSLYGSRAANGVVLIETIKGKSGQTNIQFNAYYGLQEVPQKGRVDMMNSREFAQFKKEIAEVNGRPVDPAFQNPEEYGEGTDWFDVLMRTAPVQNYSLSLSTGTEKFNTSAVLGYFNQEGVVVNTGYERFSFRVNSTFKPSKKLSIGVNVAPTYSIQSNPNIDGTLLFGAIINSAVLTSPMAKAVNDDGTIPLSAVAPGMWPAPNWLKTAQDRVMDTYKTRLLSNAFIEVEPISGLKLKSSINADLGNSRYHEFYPSTVGGFFRLPPQIPTGRATNTSYYSWVNENTAMFQKQIEKHSFDLLAGFTAQEFHLDYNDISASQFPDDKVQIISAAGQTTTNADIQEWSLLSYLARLNYNYNNKYIVSLSLRRDGSSRFGSSNKWGNFPSVSLGWVLSDEEFMPELNNVSMIKLRASYGIVGNFNIGNYTHYSNITSSNYAFGNGQAVGRSLSNLGDSELGWETNKQFNLGVDLNIFQNRIQFKYDYFKKNTSDLLYSVEIPLSSGFSQIQTNIGEIEVWGHEFLVSTSNNFGKLKWNADFNISFTKNEVISLGLDDAPLYSGDEITDPYATMVGYPVGIFYGMVHEGVYVDQADFDSSPKHTSSQVGTVKFKDVSKDGEITQDDRAYLGSPHPDFIFGFTNAFNYKNFDFSITMAGSVGNLINARTEQFSTNLDGAFNVLAEVQDHWRSPEDPGSGKYGSLAAGTTFLERDWFSDRFLYDGSYLAIKNITMGYRFQFKNLSYLKSLRLYTSIQQAHIFTSYHGNPEVNISRSGEANSSSLTLGSDYSGYPVPRTISLGINLEF